MKTTTMEKMGKNREKSLGRKIVAYEPRRQASDVTAKPLKENITALQVLIYASHLLSTLL